MWWPFKKKEPVQTFWWPEDELEWQRNRPRTLSSEQTQKLLGAEAPIPVGSVHEALNIYVGHNRHDASDQCGYDRLASINEDTYVCTCGWRAAPKDAQ